ncbi:MAG: anaerobic ribonucleoside-triphosphate reductase activating protein [Candidatus Obscuribacterales bacterium]|jgi:anaerobic ribonucleoside-triphosphate reductase activating protein|nr:anaerobic ribonucleoside-triphosphate reductase activating protein [Candidatus Obscuribacterales bacterium]
MLEVGGLVPFSATDYPGQISAVIFCQGCPWRCSYCHNSHLQEFSSGNVKWHNIIDFLNRRRGLLDAVVFSGGEPTLQKAIFESIREVKSLGYLIGLHTAGIESSRFEQVLHLVDWVGLDVKALPENYDAITGRKNSEKNVIDSLNLLVRSRIAYEVRTTVHDENSALSIGKLAEILSNAGVENYTLQIARSSDRKEIPIDPLILKTQLSTITPLFTKLGIR